MSENKTFLDFVDDSKTSKIHAKIKKLKRYKWFYKIKSLLITSEKIRLL